MARAKLIPAERLYAAEAILQRAIERRERHEARCKRCAEDHECSIIHVHVDAVARATARVDKVTDEVKCPSCGSLQLDAKGVCQYCKDEHLAEPIGV